MVVDNKILDNLSEQAKANPRLRQAMDLRNSTEDLSQRMLNALEPGTIMPIHRHHASSETVVILRGRIRWIFFDENGNETERVVLDADGDCQIRRKIVQKLGEREYLTVIHPTAIIADSVRFGYGTVVMAGAILNPYATVGNHCIINTGASIDHDCIIHDFVHIAPHSTLCGEVEIGEGTWVGAGTTIKQGVHVGKDCFIGAGSVVVKDIPDGCLCYGNPARAVKKH